MIGIDLMIEIDWLTVKRGKDKNEWMNEWLELIDWRYEEGEIRMNEWINDWNWLIEGMKKER